MRKSDDFQDRALGCMAGLLIGDALGGQVEFMSPEEIRGMHPDGVRELRDGGVWGTKAGQPTDDGEMALALMRSIIANGGYDRDAALVAYREWLASGPFDCGNTIFNGLSGIPNFGSQANGALMRCAPLALLPGDIQDLVVFAKEDALLTHPNPVTVQANQFFVALAATFIRGGGGRAKAEKCVRGAVEEVAQAQGGGEVDESLLSVIEAAATDRPSDYTYPMGWVLIALQNALWQLPHAETFEEALVDTIGRGRDTDTNAAICGALLGAALGAQAIPRRWMAVLEKCRADEGSLMPRPQTYWPADIAAAVTGTLVAVKIHTHKV